MDAIAKHPCAITRDQFENENAGLFRGSADGKYLRNRIVAAYEQGWFDRDSACKCSEAHAPAVPASAEGK